MHAGLYQASRIARTFAVPRSFPVGATVDGHDVVLVDLRDLDRALQALQQAGIEAVPEFPIKNAVG